MLHGNTVIGKDIADKELCAFSSYSNALIITDSGVPREYALNAAKHFKNSKIVTIAEGESSKSIDVYKDVIAEACAWGLKRNDLIVGVGGGMVLDFAAFCAHTYMRGVDYVAVPTTLLAMADASIGGKCAVDLNKIKNIIGAFTSPKKIIIDVKYLDTLPKRQFSCGMAEIIKIAATSDKKLFSMIESEDDLSPILKRAVKLKEKITRRDPYEKNARRILNFGHTVGHALESVTGLYHGECVSVGMTYTSSAEARERIIKLLEKYSLPTKTDVLPSDFIKYLVHDKKANDNDIYAVYVDEIGKGRTVKESMSDFINKIKEKTP